MRAVFLLVSLAVAGCSAWSDTPIENYSRTDTPSDQLQRDGAACQLEGERVRTTYGWGGLAGAAGYYESRNKAFDACMRMKGYAQSAR